MKKILLAVLLGLFAVNGYAQLNITLAANLSINGQALANIGGYVDTLGNEYALVGNYNGLSIVNVSNPSSPFIAFDVPGTPSEWREVKTWGKYAYVTTEGCCNGLQIINLSNLPASITTKTWKGDGAILNQLNTIHALHIDAGYAYLFGSNISFANANQGAGIIVSLADPWNPAYVGHTPGTYIHDGYVRNDTLYSCHIYDGYFSVFDLSNKANPVSLATQITPGQFTHNSWLNTQGNVLFTTDEVTNSYLTSYDISNLGNIKELDRFQYTPGSGSIVHNVQSINDFEVVSWYKDGVAIVDAARPDNLILVGYYDTYPQGSGDGFNGDWGVYPYLPSGNLVVSDIDNGLFVLTPTYIRGCYLEGNVTDSVTGAPLNGVSVQIITDPMVKQSKLTGDYKTGIATAGTYSVQYSKAGYITKIINNVVLQNGILTTLNVQLASFATVQVIGQVVEAGTGLPIANATVHFNDSIFDNLINTDAAGNFTLPGFYPGTYDITVGAWGYRNYCISAQNVQGGAASNIFTLTKGYYDDFALDFGWVASGDLLNKWERGVPVATYSGSIVCNPGNDVNNDCGSIAYVTDNGGGGPWDHDVDGVEILTSPSFDATQYVNPIISYSRWFYDGGNNGSGAPDDTMKVSLSNGITTVQLENMHPGTPGNGTWVSKSFTINSFITPTANMKLIIHISDSGAVHNIVEGGLDKFEVLETVGLPENALNAIKLNASPNPFAGDIKLEYHLNTNTNATLIISDITGRAVETHILSAKEGTITTGKKWQAGLYLVTIITEDGTKQVMKVSKN